VDVEYHDILLFNSRLSSSSDLHVPGVLQETNVAFAFLNARTDIFPCTMKVPKALGVPILWYL